MDSGIRGMNLAAIGFKIMAALAFVGGIIKAVLIGLFRLNPTFLPFLPVASVSRILEDLGLVHTFIDRSISAPSMQEVLLLILLSIGSGLFIGFIFFAISAVLDFMLEVGVEILDLRRIRFEQGARK